MGGDEEAVCDVLARSFAIVPSEVPTWLDRARRENIRVLRERGDVVGCNMLIPMGQYFGGRSVPTTGISALGVAPERRGRGAALALMLSSARELADAGVALSTIYPTTLTLYRRAGYEVAGARYQTTVDNSALEIDLTMERGRKRSKPTRSSASATTMRSFEERDRPAIRRLYRSVMRHENGALDRGDYIWSRVEQPRGCTPYGYVVHHGDTLEGYAFLVHQQQASGAQFDVRFTDFVAKTPRANAQLWQLLVNHRSLSKNTIFHGGVHLPALIRLAEHSTQVRLDRLWQVRIVDVKRALEGRGYAPGFRAELHLDVSDEHLSRNHGRFVLDLADGLAQVRSGGKGRARLHVRSLASLYTGHHSAAQLRRMGRLEASDREVALLAAVFSGLPPAMSDMF